MYVVSAYKLKRDNLKCISIFTGSQCLYFKKYQYKFCPSSEAGQVLVDSSACDSDSLRFSVSSDLLTIDNGGRISVKSGNHGIYIFLIITINSQMIKFLHLYNT